MCETVELCGDTMQFRLYLPHWTLCQDLWHSWWSLDIPPYCILHLPVNLKKNCKCSVFTQGGSAVFLSQNKSYNRTKAFPHLLFCCFFCFRVHPTHIFYIFLKRPFNFCHHIFNLLHMETNRMSLAHHFTPQEQLLWAALTMALLSSAKVSLTNMVPRAKPSALSVSLTHSFQRGVQLCKHIEACSRKMQPHTLSHWEITSALLFLFASFCQSVTSFIIKNECLSSHNMGGLSATCRSRESRGKQLMHNKPSSTKICDSLSEQLICSCFSPSACGDISECSTTLNDICFVIGVLLPDVISVCLSATRGSIQNYLRLLKITELPLLKYLYF